MANFYGSDIGCTCASGEWLCKNPQFVELYGFGLIQAPMLVMMTLSFWRIQFLIPGCNLCLICFIRNCQSFFAETFEHVTFQISAVPELYPDYQSKPRSWHEIGWSHRKAKTAEEIWILKIISFDILLFSAICFVKAIDLEQLIGVHNNSAK